MKVNSVKATTLIQGHCYPKTKELCEKFHTWYRYVFYSSYFLCKYTFLCIMCVYLCTT